MDYLSKLPERLNDLMLEQELNAPTLSAKTGLSSSAIRSWVRGARLPTLESVIRLADYFQCSLDYITGKEEKFEIVLARPLPSLYERIRSVMKSKGVSRYSVAHKTSIRDSHITNWSRGEIPTLESICILADYLNVSLDYLVGRTDY